MGYNKHPLAKEQAGVFVTINNLQSTSGLHISQIVEV